MANAKSVNIVGKSSSRVPVLDSNGKKIGSMNLVFPVHTVLPDFEELDSTDDFGDPDTTNNTDSEYAPDVLDLLIAKEENPTEDEEDETAQAVAVGEYENCTGFDFSSLLTGSEVVFPYDTIAEPPVRTKVIIKSYDEYDCGNLRRGNESNYRRRQCYFTRRHYATVRGAQMAEDGFYVPRQQR